MAAKAQTIKSLIKDTQRVPIDSLKLHPRNPNTRPDLDEIIESLETTGMYKSLTVQQSTNYICVGNHTWLAAKKLGWTHIDAAIIDIDDAMATRILLGDNKIAKGAVLDDKLVATLLKELPDANVGTGYHQVEVDRLVSSLRVTDLPEAPKTDLTGLLANVRGNEPVDPRQDAVDNEDPDTREAQSERGAARTDYKADKDVEQIHHEPDDVEVRAELQATLEIRELEYWKGNNSWQVPDLLPDMLVQDVPPRLKTWGGWQATPDDGKSTWLYNYSLGGVKGLPMDRAVLCFYTHDAKFDGWFQLPGYYTSKFLTAGLTMAVVPDYSFYYTQSRVHHLWSVWKAQWMGRFFQEAGLKVIPRLQFDYTDPHTLEIALLGIPRNAPVIATSQQNVGDEKEHAPKIKAMLEEALTELNPGKLIYYSGPPGRRVMETVESYDQDKVTYLDNYAAVRRNTVFDKKEGLAGSKNKSDFQKVLRAARKKVDATLPDDTTSIFSNPEVVDPDALVDESAGDES